MYVRISLPHNSWFSFVHNLVYRRNSCQWMFFTACSTFFWMIRQHSRPKWGIMKSLSLVTEFPCAASLIVSRIDQHLCQCRASFATSGIVNLVAQPVPPTHHRGLFRRIARVYSFAFFATLKTVTTYFFLTSDLFHNTAGLLSTLVFFVNPHS